MRRLHDIKLARHTSPIFSLTWMIIHEIDEHSPLHGLSPEELQTTLNGIVVTMTGFDATYGQTTHARKVYYPENIVYGQRLVDIVTPLEDGRLLVDYDRFHDTEPDTPALAVVR
jgi:inward rectifier potassium channel